MNITAPLGSPDSFSPIVAHPMANKHRKTTKSSFKDTTVFFKEWMRDPARVGSLIPSSDRLSALITRHVELAHAPVLELGPGTGVFTRMLIRRGIRQQNLTLIEFSPEFAANLKERFPEARVICRDAGHLWKTRSDFILHGAAVSGLPLLSMPPAKVFRIVRGTFALLKPGAGLFQFTYGWRCPIPATVLDHLGLKAERVGTVVCNFPPASVYRITRR